MKEPTGQNKTLEDLERAAERERADLAGTVEALRGRLGGGGSGVSGIVSERARGYVESRSSAAVEGVWRRLEDHPLQTVAVAAMVAYPVVRIVTKIPAPVVLLGAGVALAGRGGARAGQSDEFRNVSITSTPVDSGATSMPESGRSEPRGPSPTSAPGNVKAAGFSSSGMEEDPGQASFDALSRVRDRATEAGRAGGETMVAAIRRSPALAGGLSLVIGAALAAILPRTRAEGRAFGEAANNAREHARSSAAEGVEAGRRAVDAAISAATDEAVEQNLTGDGARNAIREGTDKVEETIRNVADNAKDAIEGSTRRGLGEEPKGKSD